MELVMTHEETAAGIRISNWTLATGTQPGQRPIVTVAVRPTARELPQVAVIS